MKMRAILGLLVGTLVPGTALADDLLVDIGDRVELLNLDGLPLQGNWSRVYPNEDDDGYTMFITGANTYNYLTMDASFTVTSSKTQLVSDWPERLVDHMITKCPDGTWLHVASANLDQPDDSAYLFRYNSDFSMVCNATINERHPTYLHNDAPLVCTGGATATNPMDGTATHTREEDIIQTPFIFFDENCEQSAEEQHPTFPPTSGTTILWDESAGYFWQVRTQPDDFTLLFQLYGAWMVPEDRSVSVDTLVPEDQTTRWPQGSLAVGDYYIIAHLARDPAVTYGSDTGDLWLQVFDRDINHLQALKLTEYTDDQGAQRPWLTREGDQLIVTWTEYEGSDFYPALLTVSMDGSLIGEDPGTDDGSDGTDGTDATDGTDGTDGADGTPTDGTDGTGGTDGGDDGDDGSGDDGSSTDGGSTDDGDKGGCSVTGLGAMGGGALAGLVVLARRREH